MNAPSGNGLLANQRDLAAALEALRLSLERARDAEPGDAKADIPAPDYLCPPSLCVLSELLGLSSFERSVLLLAAGRELSGSFAATLAQLNGGRPWPTFSLALALLSDAHWSALAPDAPLRSWRLIELVGEGGLPERELRIDEPVLHWLTGLDGHDERIAPLLLPLPELGRLVPSHAALARNTAQRVRAQGLHFVEVSAADSEMRGAFALAVAGALGLDVAWLPGAHVPVSAHERAEVALRLRREGRLRRRTVLVDADGPDVEWMLRRLADPRSPVIASRAQPADHPLPGTLQVRLEAPTRQEMKGLWMRELDGHPTVGEDDIDRVVSDFSLSPGALASVAGSVRATVAVGACATLDLWDASRQRACKDLGELAQRIEPKAIWEELVLPQRQKNLLRDIVAQVKNRWRVYDRWGFAQKSSRGLGFSALFAGQSGTGKTMAAEVIANELGLDLYQIDLSSVVSKYIGETEKNLRRLFDTAEGSGSILFFDEADALFGKRSEVKDSHDRYANIEVSYLLQRMEAYRGLAILATNRKSALDHAFLRRIRFLVEFPFPDAADRAEIWRRVFPEATPSSGLDYARLARLHVPGGNIRSIALNAAFRAADEGVPVQMHHLLHAAQVEYVKLERPLSDTEVSGWV
jgi:hypothetical protein